MSYLKIFSFIAIYFILPETENHELEDIELYFSDDKRKITDRIIPKMMPKTVTIDNHVENGVSYGFSNVHIDNLVLRSNGFDNKGFH